MNAQTDKLAILRYAIMIFLTLIFIYPLLWLVASTFKPDQLQIFGDMRSIRAILPPAPHDGYFDNYLIAFEAVPLMKYIINSLFYSTLIVFFGLIINSMAGYAFAKLEFWLKDFIFILLLATIIVPVETIYLPLYLLIHRLGWINSYVGLIVPFVAAPLYIFLFRQFFFGIPKEVEEAARIDGASTLRAFFQIVIPLAKPVMATVAILQFTYHWTEYLWPSMLITDNGMRTIQIGINYFFNLPNVPWGPVLAAILIATMPMVIIFASFQKYYVQGLATTGMK
ncbi:carbohydrate ABC transporter permease [Cohnella sp.]|uniref:carbohydrate ABC transporter permease n=1 Tax=Cohnella sp. TaxID=1883426 RepID=UPI0035675B1B